MNAANPPAQYKVGCKVLVRRFSSKSKKKHGKGLVRKMSRVVKGTITHAKASSNQYKVRYQLNGKFEEKWYSVSDITLLTCEDEKNRQGKCKLTPCQGNIITNNWHNRYKEGD